jgi:predicted secreted protein
MKYYGPVKTAFVIVPPGSTSKNNVSKSKKDAIFLQLRHYLASVVAFVVTGSTIYFMGQNQIANQSVNVPVTASKTVPHATESLRTATSMAPYAATAPVQITPEPSTLSADPVIIVMAILGATAAFFAVFFGMYAFQKFKKIKK